MRYCSNCGSDKIEFKIPADDNLKRYVCPDCGSIFYTNPNLIVGTVCIKNEEVLLCKRNIEPRFGKWTLPAGFMENAETLQEGALRETLEEAKLQVSDVKLFTILSVPHIIQIYTFFTGKVVNDDFGPTPESSEVELFKFDDIPWSELAFPTVIKTLKLFLEHGDVKVINETLKPRV